jgi:hypothetical protein
MPPTLKSIFDAVTMKPFGPHHFFISSGLAKASKTISRGALNVREMTNGFWAMVVDIF